MTTWQKWLLGGAVLTAALFVPIHGKGHGQVPSLTLDWTAPGDDGGVGTATTYEMRFNSTQPDTTNATTMATWWAAGIVVTNMPVPQIAGTRQSVTITRTFYAGVTYWFVMRAIDEVGNVSPYSNVAVKTIPTVDSTGPRRIIDLLIR